MERKNLISKSKNISYDIILFKINEFKCSNYNNFIRDFAQLEKLFKYNKKNIFTEILFFSKHNIHKILFVSNEIIDFDYKIIKKKNLFPYLFYLDLLIVDQPIFVDYSYNIKLINKIHEINKKETNSIKKLFISRIIIDLINNYKNLENYDEYKEEKMINLTNEENENIISNSITKFKDFNLEINIEKIKKDKIDKIYIEIIILLIKSNNLENLYLFSQLGLENIKISEEMLLELKNALSLHNKYMQQYEIIELNEIFNPKKNKFYYFLFKYVLKNPIYIYQIPLLFNLRIKLKQAIKSNLIENILSNIINEIKITNKIIYVINTILDSKYYFDKFKNSFNKIIVEKYNLYYQNIINNKLPISYYLFNSNHLKSLNKNEIVKKLNILNHNSNKKKKKYNKLVNQNIKEQNINKELENYNIEKYTFLNEDNKFIMKKKLENDNKKEIEENNINNIIIHNNYSDCPKKEEIIINKKTKYNWKKKKKEDSSKRSLDPSLKNDEYMHIRNLILNNSKFYLSNNIKNKIFINEIYIGEYFIKLNTDKYKDYIHYFLSLNKKDIFIKSYLKLSDFIEFIKNKIQKEFKYNYRLNIELYFKKANKKNCQFFNISFKFAFYDPTNGQKIELNEINILVNGFKSEIKNKIIKEINKESFEDIPYYDYKNEDNNDCSLHSLNFIVQDNLDNENENNCNLIISLKSKKNFPKLDNKISFIKSFQEGYYFAFSENKILIYNEFRAYKKEISEFKNSKLKISYIYYNKNNKYEVKLLINSNNKFYLLLLNLKQLKYEIKEVILWQNGNVNKGENDCKKNLFSFLIENNRIISDKNSINYFIYYNNNNNESKQFINEFLRSEIKNYILLIKNESSNDSDILYFINFHDGKRLKKIKGYFFSTYSYSLSEIRNNKNKEETKILFACKKYNYIKNKNGILLIIPYLKNGREMFDYFYETGNFEVYCICQISNKKEESNNKQTKNLHRINTQKSSEINSNSSQINNNIIRITHYDNVEISYFLAGGFDIIKKHPLIKLYKLSIIKRIFKEKIEIEIEFIQDIEVENGENYVGPIICIIQSDNFRNILAVDLNGVIHTYCVYLINNEKK